MGYILILVILQYGLYFYTGSISINKLFFQFLYYYYYYYMYNITITYILL